MRFSVLEVVEEKSTYLMNAECKNFTVSCRFRPRYTYALLSASFFPYPTVKNTDVQYSVVHCSETHYTSIQTANSTDSCFSCPQVKNTDGAKEELRRLRFMAAALQLELVREHFRLGEGG